MSEPTTSQNHNELHDRIQQLRREVSTMRQYCSGYGREFAIAQAGKLAEDMIANPSNIKDYLFHSLPNVRLAALGLLLDSIIYEESLSGALMHLVLEDPDTQIRLFSLLLLGKLYDGSRDQLLGRFYAKVVVDEHQPSPVRLAAYQSLLYLEDLSVDWNPPVYAIRFPEDINWSFLKRYLE